MKIIAYRGKWEFQFDLTLEQFQDIDGTIRQLEMSGYSSTRPYEPKGSTEFTPTNCVFDRFEVRDDGKAGTWAIARTAEGKEVKTVVFQKLFKKGMMLVTGKNDKGFIEFQFPDSPMPF